MYFGSFFEHLYLNNSRLLDLEMCIFLIQLIKTNIIAPGPSIKGPTDTILCNSARLKKQQSKQVIIMGTGAATRVEVCTNKNILFTSSLYVTSKWSAYINCFYRNSRFYEQGDEEIYLIWISRSCNHELNYIFFRNIFCYDVAT